LSNTVVELYNATLSVHQLLKNTDECVCMDIKHASVVLELLWMLLRVLLLLLLLIHAAYFSWLLLLLLIRLSDYKVTTSFDQVTH
jgi:hypothetical protein